MNHTVRVLNTPVSCESGWVFKENDLHGMGSLKHSVVVLLYPDFRFGSLRSLSSSSFFVGQRGTKCQAYRGLYGCPGGKVEEIDYNYCGNFLCGLFRAASRELIEETGVYCDFTALDLLWTDVGIPGYAIHYFAAIVPNAQPKPVELDSGMMCSDWILLQHLGNGVKAYGIIPEVAAVKARLEILNKAKADELSWSDAQDSSVIPWVFFETPSVRSDFALINRVTLDYFLSGFHKKNIKEKDWEEVFRCLCEYHHAESGYPSNPPSPEKNSLHWIPSLHQITREAGLSLRQTDDLILDGTVEYIWAHNF